MQEFWVSVDEVANHLGVAKDSVYRWIESKRLPAHRVGRLWKFKISEVDKWVHTGSAGRNDNNRRKQNSNEGAGLPGTPQTGREMAHIR